MPTFNPGTYPIYVTSSYGKSNIVNLVIETSQALIPGDINKDGIVNDVDKQIVLSNWNRRDCSEKPNNWCEGADINRDGFVGLDDLNTVLRNFNSDGKVLGVSTEISKIIEILQNFLNK